MFKFLKMQDYTIEKRSLKDGFMDLLTSTKDIGNNLKNFSIIVFIFIAVAILKDFMLASTVVENYDHQNQNSLMLQGQGDFGYIFYLISFFVAFMTYFFTIDAFSQVKEGIFIKDSLKFSLVKLLDYRVYLVCLQCFFL